MFAALSALACGGSVVESAAPDALQVAPAAVSVQAGRTARLSMIASSKGRSVPGVTATWSSNAPAVATVDNTGLLTGIARGSAQLTVSIPGTGAVGRVPVTVLGVSNVALNVSTALLDVGRTQQLTALVTTDPGVTPQAVSWTSSNAAIATVSSSGLLTAVGPGQATITASCDGRSATVSVVVVRPSVATVTLAPASIELRVGQTSGITATVRDGTGNVLADRQVSWSSSNPSIATIGTTVATSAIVTAVAPGIATIVASAEGVQRAALITVTPLPDAVGSLSVSPTSASLLVGQTRSLSATVVQPTGAPPATVTYGTTAPAVATVSATGVITAVGTGTALINVTASAPANGSFAAKALSATVSLSVAAATPSITSMSASPSSASVTVGQPVTIVPAISQPVGAPQASISFRSLRPNIATVSSTGLVTGLAAGSAEIEVSATSAGNTFYRATTISRVVVIPVLRAGAPLLGSNQTVGGLSSASGEQYFHVQVPPGSPKLMVQTYGGSGRADLFLWDPSSGGSSTYACRSSGSTMLLCEVDDPQSGLWTVQLNPFPGAGFSGTTLSVNPTVPTLQLGDVRTGLASALGHRLFNVTVPEGTPYLLVRTSGGDGIVRLVLRQGQSYVPTQNCPASNELFTTKLCAVSAPSAGLWTVELAPPTVAGYTSDPFLSLKLEINPTIPTIPLNSTVPDLSLRGGDVLFNVVIPAGTPRLSLRVSGGQGALYILAYPRNVPLGPTACAGFGGYVGYSPCDVNAPIPGIWTIRLARNLLADFSGFTLHVNN